MGKSIQTLLVGTYTNPDFDVSETGKGIYTLEFDPATAGLAVVGVTSGIENPSYLAVAPSGNRVYAVLEKMVRGGFLPGEVASFSLGGRGTLNLLNSVPSHGSCPCHLSIDHSGHYLFAANYVDGTVGLFPLGPDGRVGEAVQVDRHQGRGPTDRQTGPHAHMVLGSPDGRFVYSVDLGTDQVLRARWEAGAGSWEPLPDAYSTLAGAGPRHLAFHPVLDRAYLVAELNATVEVLSVDRKSGALERAAACSTLPPGETGFAGCSAIRISPDGRFLYVGNRGAYHSIAAYRLDPATGTPEFLGTFPTGGRGPRDFILDRTGAFILVANQETCSVTVLTRNPETGLPGSPVGSASVPTPVCLTLV